MAVKLHRCPVTFAKAKAHPCWKVQTALDEAGVDYEVVKEPLFRWNRKDYKRRPGSACFPRSSSRTAPSCARSQTTSWLGSRRAGSPLARAELGERGRSLSTHQLGEPQTHTTSSTTVTTNCV
jgi:hypothetical protein